MPRITFWFEFASTYSYLAATRIDAEAAARGVDVVWRPVPLGPIFGAQGWRDSPFNIYPAKGRNMWRDMERQATKLGLPPKSPRPPRSPPRPPRSPPRCAKLESQQSVTANANSRTERNLFQIILLNSNCHTKGGQVYNGPQNRHQTGLSTCRSVFPGPCALPAENRVGCMDFVEPKGIHPFANRPILRFRQPCRSAAVFHCVTKHNTYGNRRFRTVLAIRQTLSVLLRVHSPGEAASSSEEDRGA